MMENGQNQVNYEAWRINSFDSIDKELTEEALFTYQSDFYEFSIGQMVKKT